jgi:hypothetical protein
MRSLGLSAPGDLAVTGLDDNGYRVAPDGRY